MTDRFGLETATKGAADEPTFAGRRGCDRLLVAGVLLSVRRPDLVGVKGRGHGRVVWLAPLRS